MSHSFVGLLFLVAASPEEKLGDFDSHGDVGVVLHRGAASFDRATKRYTLSGSGENMWFKSDAYYFVWKRMEGDVDFAADIEFQGSGGNPHRKACLMIRQSLDADAAYVDVAVHGDGLTSLQFRDAKGANTHEVQSHRSSPTRVRLVKRGAYCTLYLAGRGEPLGFSGAAARIDFSGTVFVGLCICAHDKAAVETAVFSNVEVKTPSSSNTKPQLFSTLETQSLNSTDRRVVHVARGGSKRRIG
jgi:hypothetical protein